MCNLAFAKKRAAAFAQETKGFEHHVWPQIGVNYIEAIIFFVGYMAR
jgi:hypothetical protein